MCGEQCGSGGGPSLGGVGAVCRGLYQAEPGGVYQRGTWYTHTLDAHIYIYIYIYLHTICTYIYKYIYIYIFTSIQVIDRYIYPVSSYSTPPPSAHTPNSYTFNPPQNQSQPLSGWPLAGGPLSGGVGGVFERCSPGVLRIDQPGHLLR